MYENNCEKKVIPIFYACDDGFVKYTIVSIKSIIENASKKFNYVIYILNTDVSENMIKETLKLECDNFEIRFIDVKEWLCKIGKDLPLRDYYSKTTYFRLFIAEMFVEYEKVIYIDSDTIVLGDISNLYNTDIGDKLVGACHEQVMVQTKVYGNYVEKVLGINRKNYFNAGVLLINCCKFRESKVLNQFIKLLEIYNFVVTQDEDYLNVICQNRVYWLDQSWNTEVYGRIIIPEKEIKVLHYIMASKPWNYKDCRFKEYFWEYSKKTSVYEKIKYILDNYSRKQKKKDRLSCKQLIKIAKKESVRKDRYINLIAEKNLKEELVNKIKQYEKELKYDIDINDDPETITLLPNKVDYLGEKFRTRIATKIANKVAENYYEREIKKGNLIIKDVYGIENYKAVKGGAILTCNHFSPNDNYAVWRAIRNEFSKGKRLYKIIREGNYTNYCGLFGYFFRHCNTLPLSSNPETMKKLLKSINVLLKRGEKILIYPEQAMWWNYKKPRPLKNGAFKFSVKNNVPVIPFFITMKDTTKKDKLGFNIQEYTVWILPAIYPKDDLTDKENAEYMKDKNYECWKDLYEKVYGEKLYYGE